MLLTHCRMTPALMPAILFVALATQAQERGNPPGGALAGDRPRVIVSTDIGGSDPDDFQSMVHFLVYGDGGKYVGEFEKYLHNLANGLPSAEAFKRSFGEDIAAFENRWKQYALAARPSALVTALERLEFLAEGALELARLKRHPRDLGALKAGLREINFTHVLKTHGVESRLSAADDAMFQIPADDLCPEPPVFIVAPLNLHGLSRREQRLEQLSPTPPSIGTEHLRPRNLAVKWVRDPQDHSFRYELDLR